jgi:O-antigen/teichoic acid export membrane protein
MGAHMRDIQGVFKRKDKDESMKRFTKYILSVLGLTVVLLFCMSASTGIEGRLDEVKPLLSEPMSMVLFGLVMIGASQFIRNKKV